MHEIFQAIGDIGYMPVVILDKADDAVPLCRALIEGGLPLAEITMRTPAALEAIRRIAGELPEVLLGAGTVITAEQAEAAVEAGARFVVSPGFHASVVRFCKERKVPVIPGCSTPTEIGWAVEQGLDVVKFFPAEAFGGVETLRMISGPYPMVRYMPTGGVSAGNLAGYLAFEKVIAGGGSWVVEPSLVRAGNFAAITRLARETVSTILGFVLVGGPESLAGKLQDALGVPVGVREGQGEIVLEANSLRRAVAYLGRTGIGVESDCLKLDGFTVRLRQREA